MKAKITKSILAPQRCQHLSPSGRQCCSPAAAPGSTLYARHAAIAPQQSVDFSAELLAGCGDFQRAQQINHSLIALYKLLAQGRISPSQRAVLAYIGSLVLRSLKAIDYDLDRFTPDDADPNEESENISAESDDESGEEPGDAPPTEPVAANPVGPGKEPLPVTAQSSPPKSSTANPIDLRVCEARSVRRGAALLRPCLPRCRRRLGPPACRKQACYLGRRVCVAKPFRLGSPCRAPERRSRIGNLGTP